MIQKRWALRHKLGQKGPLSFTPAHKHKIRAVMHNVGKRIPHKNLLLSIPQSLVFIYITFSHLQHPKTPLPTPPTNLCSPKRSAQALSPPAHSLSPISKASAQQGENSLELYCCLIHMTDRFFLCVNSSAFHSPLCTCSAAFLSQKQSECL